MNLALVGTKVSAGAGKVLYAQGVAKIGTSLESGGVQRLCMGIGLRL